MINKIKNAILASKLVVTVIQFYAQITIGKSKLPLKSIIHYTLQEIEDDDVSGRAASVSFNFLMAIFPSVIFLFTLIPYIPIPNLAPQILAYLKEIMPNALYSVASDTITDIISKPRSGLLSFGFLFAWFAALNGTLAIIEAFNKMHQTHEKRGFIKKRLVAGFLIFLLAMVLVSSVVLLFVGQVVLDYVTEKEMLSDILVWLGVISKKEVVDTYIVLLGINILRYSVVIFSFFMAIALIYKIAPSSKKKWNFVSAGSVFATLLGILSSYLFSIYITNFATYNKLYGSIGTLIGLMLWLYLLANILLIGFELNVAIDHTKQDLQESKNNKDNAIDI